jgi:hypothetical protein
MRDFDSEFNRMRRSGERMAIFVRLWIGFCAILMLTIVGFGAYFALTLEPEDIGAFVGKVVSGYKDTQP